MALPAPDWISFEADKTEGPAMAKTQEEKSRIKAQAIEVPAAPVVDEQFAAVNRRLEEAPPVRFDIARQVRVFNAYLQYVELELSGAAIQRHRLAIPPSIQKLGGAKDLEGRLRTTFDLIEEGGQLSSKALEKTLNDIRKAICRTRTKRRGHPAASARNSAEAETAETAKTDIWLPIASRTGVTLLVVADPSRTGSPFWPHQPPLVTRSVLGRVPRGANRGFPRGQKTPVLARGRADL